MRSSRAARRRLYILDTMLPALGPIESQHGGATIPGVAYIPLPAPLEIQ